MDNHTCPNSNCQAVIDPEEKYCGECGVKLDKVQSLEKNYYQCGCGEVIHIQKKFCKNCGHKNPKLIKEDEANAAKSGTAIKKELTIPTIQSDCSDRQGEEKAQDDDKQDRSHNENDVEDVTAQLKKQHIKVTDDNGHCQQTTCKRMSREADLSDSTEAKRLKNQETSLAKSSSSDKNRNEERTSDLGQEPKEEVNIKTDYLQGKEEQPEVKSGGSKNDLDKEKEANIKDLKLIKEDGTNVAKSGTAISKELEIPTIQTDCSDRHQNNMEGEEKAQDDDKQVRSHNENDVEDVTAQLKKQHLKGTDDNGHCQQITCKRMSGEADLLHSTEAKRLKNKEKDLQDNNDELTEKAKSSSGQHRNEEFTSDLGQEPKEKVNIKTDNTAQSSKMPTSKDIKEQSTKLVTSVFSSNHGAQKASNDNSQEKVFGGATTSNSESTQTERKSTNIDNDGSGNTHEMVTRAKGKTGEKSSEASKYHVNNKNTSQPHNVKSQKDKHNTSHTNATSNSAEKVTLFFHVVLSPDFNYTPKCQVQLRTDHKVIGGDRDWNNTSNIMTHKKALPDGYHLFEFKVTIPQQTMGNGQRMYYKYVMSACGSDPPFNWEFLYKKTHKGKVKNRSFFIPTPDLSQIDEWHQYDGVMHLEPDKNIFQDAWARVRGNRHKKIIADTKLAAKVMLSKWSGFSFESDSDDSCTAENVLVQISQVYKCLKTYLVTEDCLHTDDEYFKQVLYDYINPRMEKLRSDLKNQANFEETPEEATIRLAATLSIVWLCVRFQLKYNTTEMAKPILFGLTLHCNKRERSCVAYETLVGYHFSRTKERITDYLQEFLSNMVTPYDLCVSDWLRAISLYHFLSNQSQPFVPFSPSEKHRNEEWWGTIGLDKIIGTYQTRMGYPKNMPVKYFFRVLVPLMEADALLQRTITAVFNFSDLQEAIKENVIDSYIIIANLYFHSKNAMYITESEKNAIHGYVNGISQKLVDEVKEVRDLETGYPRKCAEISAECKIVLDFFEEMAYKCKVTTAHELLHSVCIVVFRVIQKYQIIRNKIMEENYEKVNVQNITGQIDAAMQSVADILCRWLDSVLEASMMWRSYSYGYGYSCIKMKDHNELKIFSWILYLDTYDDEKNEWWKNKFLMKLQNRLEKQGNPRDKVELFCREECSGYHPLIEESFSRTAFDIIEKGTQGASGDYNFVFDLIEGRDGEKFRKLLSRMFENSWPKTEDQYAVLEHILTWSSFVRYVRIFYGRAEELLTEDSQNKMAIGLSLFEEIWREFKNGKLSINILKLVIFNSMAFSEICAVQDDKSKDDKTLKDQFSVILGYRKSELESFETLFFNVQGLVGFIKLIPGVNCENLSHRLSSYTENIQLLNLCIPQMTGSIASNITYFQVPNDVIAILEDFNNIKHSVTFEKMWKINGNRLFKHKQQTDDGEISLDELVQKVWFKTYNEIKDLLNKLMTGMLTFQEVDATFKQFKQNYKEMKCEIETMRKALGVTDSDSFEKRVKQIEQYNQLNNYRKGAEVMKEIKEGFKLTGDFKVLDLLISAVPHSWGLVLHLTPDHHHVWDSKSWGRNMPGKLLMELQDCIVYSGDDKSKMLLDLTEEVVKSGKALQVLDDKRTESIEVFHKAMPLVKWLQESVKGTKEIKVLVDLAMMSAQGQGDMEVHRVSCLHAAAVGYAPLIYELETNAGFQEFLHHCEQVWKSLEADPDLPKKLSDTACLLDWLKHVKDSHGSVELDALSQAESINARGIYKVGCLDKDKDSITKSINDVLTLKVPPENREDWKDNEKWKSYDFEKLKDLQSKLMLVAGKATQGKEQVDRFVEIFDGVARLASTYTKLCKAGSILFKNWNAVFYCEPGRKVHSVIDFGLSDKTLQGTTKTCKHVTKQIFKLCDFMDDCLELWQHNIEVRRGEFYFLNHFTTEQLVILRREMASLCLEDKQHIPLKNKIYLMLSSVKAKCTPQDLLEAVQSAMEDLATPADCDMAVENLSTDLTENTEIEMVADTDYPQPDPTDNVENSSDKSEIDPKKLKKFFEDLEYAGFSKRLAFKALEKVRDPHLIEEATMWCMEHEDDFLSETCDEMTTTNTDDVLMTEDSIGDSPGEDDDEQHCSLNVGSMGTSVDPLESKKGVNYSSIIKQQTLEGLTRQLLEERDKNSDLKEQLELLWLDYIKTSTSASVSDFLSVEHLGYILEHLALRERRELNRPLPSTLQEGKPNLIVCPQGETLQTVLSLYMYEQGKKLPLPSSDEILVCTHNTRLEEIELLWRRAFGMHKDGKIFCLMNVDRLDYEVSKKAEETFEKISKGKQYYKLVVICCQEREDKSNLVTAFDRYRVKNPFIYSMKVIRQYLNEHYILNQQHGTAVPAAHIDPERCGVRVIKSERAGVGKTLLAKRFEQQMKAVQNNQKENVYISLHRKQVDVSEVLRQLLDYTKPPNNTVSRIFHIDVAHEVQEGVDDLLFNLLVLGSLTDQQGYVWLRSDMDLYLVEVMPLVQKDIIARGARPAARGEESLRYVHQIFHYLPSMMCWSPSQSLDILQKTNGNRATSLTDYPDYQMHDQLMDEQEFKSITWQRVFQYLMHYSAGQDLNAVNPLAAVGNPMDCIAILLRYCGIRDPSWAELRHLVWFLNLQLLDCDESGFCSAGAAEDLPGFKLFVVKSMIQMSRDFATRSLVISEQTPGFQRRTGQGIEDDLELFQMKRHWETSPHPYVFFNSDRHSMTFLGFNIDARGNMLDQRTNAVLEQNVMPKPLQEALVRNRVPLNENFDRLARGEKITKLCAVMGNEYPHDPDSTYVLTTDNTKKILAIYMRFRCGIPVIIMGETGCGKTRLIKFMCDLQKPPGVELNNMILMKVHGGTTETDIRKKLKTALQLAKENRHNFSFVDTVLFFDEANTTEEIGLIKQVMCDQEVLGAQKHGLKIVAACNPYRKHSDDMVKKLEQAGLGYHIEADQTTDKLGHIPMRRLVYRVQALPQSMLPLVWDFGQLNTDTEQSYIEEMVNKFIIDDKLPNIPDLQVSVSRILTASQEFMRDQKDECSFVSLRDVERTLKVMVWFYQHRKPLFDMMDESAKKDIREREGNIEEEFEEVEIVTRSLVLALGVCYHACLENREDYRDHVAGYFSRPLQLARGADTLRDEISRCQDVFLTEVELEDNIARNQALKENVFMMVVCIELRIPLFLVGKPGSSKSLAKTIVADCMQGDAARSDLFKEFKSVHMVSFQCSPLSTPDGIVSTFRQCAALQNDKNLDDFVSVVVLDEIGLAEDSPRMPLKTLHPLLEDGCEGDEEPAPHKKVAFIGISNWALDPAKMNRGILVQRGVPDDKELQNSAEGICAQHPLVKSHIRDFLGPMAKAYLELYNSALEIREFFGLRDFYSIIKMVYNFSKRSSKPPTWFELKHAILRNFGGLDNVEPLQVFEKHMIGIEKKMDQGPNDPDCSAQGLIKACLFGEGLDGINSESRYLLILTENYAALKILEQQLLQLNDAIYIFGSSFPKDQEYTQVCRNINRIKICMETGQKVVLLNLDNLYESLYDALNQYYVWLGGQRFVDLGLGSHRVKCKVHEDFRLIVVAEKQVVYQKFPIPLINRLEKHTLTMETILTDEQQELSKELDSWAKAFATVDSSVTSRENKFTVGDVFIGYDKDTAASIVLQVTRDTDEETGAIEILEKGKSILLQCATPEAVIRLQRSQLRNEAKQLRNIYYKQQEHTSLQEFLASHLQKKDVDKNMFVQVTTHSKMLSRADLQQITAKLGMDRNDLKIESLQEFDTEQQFCKQLENYFGDSSDHDKILVLQCDTGDENTTLIASAQYSIIGEYRQKQKLSVSSDLVDRECSSMMMSIQPLVDPATFGKRHVVFIIQLPRKPGGCFVGFQGGEWMSCHIDELRPQEEVLPSYNKLNEHSLSSLFESAMKVNAGEITANIKSACPETEMSVIATVNEFEDMPLLEGYTEDDYIKLGYWKNRKEHPGEDIMDTDDAVANSMHPVGIAENETPMEVTETDNKELDLDSIIRSCIHSAAAMLEDEGNEEQTQRKTYRVQLLLKLLSKKNKDKSKLDFLGIVIKRVGLLLKDKETTVSTPDRAKQWLTNDAASQAAVTKAGTFRRAIIQNIEAKVTPLLAGVISFCDSNQNLDLLMQDSDQEIWIKQYWLQLFNSENITSLSYQDLQTAMQIREVERLRVPNHGCEGTNFTCRLPFSWIIKEQMILLIHNNKKTGHHDVEDKDPLALVTKLFNQSEVGKIVQNVVGSEIDSKHQNFIGKYVSDFVNMVYKCQSRYIQEELQLIENAVQVTALEIHNISKFFQETDIEEGYTETHENEKIFVLTVPGVHMAFDILQSRIQLFAQAVASWPEAVINIHRFKLEKADHELNANDEFTLDILILFCILETLTPVKNEIDQVMTRLTWLEKVEKQRPIIERMLETMAVNVQNRHPLGEKSMQWLGKCRSMWSRVCTVQLFIEHVCPRHESKDKLSTKRCMPLWTVLGEETNFKEVKSMNKLEHFLKISNKSALEHFMGESRDCAMCQKLLSDPVQIPCKNKHEVCVECIQTQLQLEQRWCPICKEKLPQSYKPKLIKQDHEKKKAYEQYKQRCNAFFMDLVSRLCFAGGSPPSEELVKKLLGYVTKEPAVSQTDDEAANIEGGVGHTVLTRRMAAFQDTIDPTPVVRSFLLQLLLRSHVDEVRIHLASYFEESRKISKENDHLVQLSLLFVYCLEDAYHTSYQQNPDLGKAIRKAREITDEALNNINRIGLSVDKLEAIAGARFGLYVAAEWMHRVHTLNETIGQVRDTKRLFEAAERLCDQENKWPRLYVIRQLFKRFGIESLQVVGQVQHLMWVLPAEARENQNDVQQPDRYVVCGENYKTVRETLTQALITEDTQKLSKVLKSKKQKDNLMQRDFLLAVYREVTLNYRKEYAEIRENAINVLKQFINDEEMITNKPMGLELVNNNLAENCKHLIVLRNQNVHQNSISELVVHFWVMLSMLKPSAWIQPFLNFIKNPRQMATSLFPTMPQDELEYIREALLGARKAGDENPSLYRCPNGHIYVIGNCGRPVERRHCKTCNAPIGGAGYKLEAGNEVIEHFQDKTSHGHILGLANQRSRIPIPERDLSPGCSAVLRLLMHISMYLSTNNKAQEISELIKPAVDGNNVSQFLWEHITVDLEVISKAINKSPDDTVLLMHMLLNGMLTSPVRDAKGLDPALQTKKARREWEKRFADVHISPALQGVQEKLQNANQQLLNDDRLGNNPLLKILYEMDATTGDCNIMHMEKASGLWQFRSRVTIENLTQNVMETNQPVTKKHLKRASFPDAANKEFSLLKLFLQHEPLLRALRFMPQISRLQRLLVQKYHGSIDRAEAQQISITEFLRRLPKGPVKEEYKTLIDSFAEAWLLLKEHLDTFGFGGLVIPKDYSSVNINGETPLAMFLPSWKGHGLCSVASIYFLASIQNDFLETYGRIIKQSPSGFTDSPLATPAHLISYHPESDLLPLVFANSNYSLKLGGNTNHEYDFQSLEKQIQERFIKGRTLIKAKVETVVFRADFTNAGVFEILKKKITQVPLDTTLQQQIISQSRYLTELNDSISMLDIAIGFLVSVGGDPQVKLKEFLVKTLEMKKVVHSGKAMQQCCLKHVQALWLLLSHERAKRQAQLGQPVYDSVADKYHEQLTQEQIASLHNAMQQINVQSFMTELYECIMLNISVPQDENDPEYVDNRDQPLGYVLNEYLEEQQETFQDESNNGAGQEDLSKEGVVFPFLTNGLFPADIQLKNCVDAWLRSYEWLKMTAGRY